MRHATLYRYQLPMDSGVILRNEKLAQREGFIVELTENGRTARGEIAPLPALALKRWKKRAYKHKRCLSFGSMVTLSIGMHSILRSPLAFRWRTTS
ncbi:o-succinylbenzoate-CoA synthase [Vibrio cholerae]|nr:o-succinylbenzoate-CoA synthase [Vibrio cholerae]